MQVVIILKDNLLIYSIFISVNVQALNELYFSASFSNKVLLFYKYGIIRVIFWHLVITRISKLLKKYVKQYTSISLKLCTSLKVYNSVYIYLFMSLNIWNKCIIWHKIWEIQKYQTFMETNNNSYKFLWTYSVQQIILSLSLSPFLSMYTKMLRNEHIKLEYKSFGIIS